MKKGVYGKKLGMTQIYDQDGLVIPVTVFFLTTKHGSTSTTVTGITRPSWS